MQKPGAILQTEHLGIEFCQYTGSSSLRKLGIDLHPTVVASKIRSETATALQ